MNEWKTKALRLFEVKQELKAENDQLKQCLDKLRRKLTIFVKLLSNGKYERPYDQGQLQAFGRSLEIMEAYLKGEKVDGDE